MLRTLNALMLAALLAGCSATAQPPAPTMSDQEAFARARLRVTESLKDPDAAKFGTHMFIKNSTYMFGQPTQLVCGTVNGKNSFGAYTGASTFAYRVADDRVFIDGGRENLASMWCVWG